MDLPLKETPKQVYTEPTLQEHEQLDEVVWGDMITTTTGVGF